MEGLITKVLRVKKLQKLWFKTVDGSFNNNGIQNITAKLKCRKINQLIDIQMKIINEHIIEM